MTGMHKLHHRQHRLSRLFSSVAVLSLLAAPVAMAQDTGNDPGPTILKTITVNARKVSEPLKDVPFSITALPADVLEAAGIDATQALERNTPGFNFADSGLTFSNLVNMRGIGSASALISPSVNYYVDGVPVPVRVFDQPFGDVEQIEVLRGPQGTLFGLNSQAGAVSITTRDPAQTAGGSAGVEFGSDGHKQLSGTLEGPLSETISARVSGRLSDENGDLTNIRWSAPGVISSSNSDLRARLYGALNGKVVIAPDTGSKITITGGWSRDRQKPTTGLWLDDPGFPRNAFNPLPELETETVHFGITAAHDLEWANFTSVTGFQYYDTSMTADIVDGFLGNAQTGLPGFAFQTPGLNVRRIAENSRQFSQEFRLDGETEGGTRWVTGLSGFYSAFDSTTDITSLSLANGSYQGKIDTLNLAAFGEVTVPLADRLNWIGGLRLSHERKDFEGLFLGRNGARARFAENGEQDYNFITGRTGLTYALTDDVTVFATVARGEKTGGYLFYNQFASAGLPLSPYASAATWSYEAGVKSQQLGGFLDMSLSGFYNDTSDEQLFTYNPVLGRFSVQNADTRSYGLELEARAQATHALSFTGNLALLNAEINGGQNPLLIGKDVPYAPSFSAGIAAEYRDDLDVAGQAGSGFLRAEYSYTGSRQIDPANSRKLDGYSLVNLRAGWQTERYDIYGAVENIFNDSYVSSAFQAGTTTAGAPVFAGIPGEGRTFKIGAKVKF